MTDKIKTNEFDVKVKYESVIKFSGTNNEMWFKTSDDSMEIFTDENKILTQEDYEGIYIYLLHKIALWGKNKLNTNNQTIAKYSFDIITSVFKKEETND